MQNPNKMHEFMLPNINVANEKVFFIIIATLTRSIDKEFYCNFINIVEA